MDNRVYTVMMATLLTTLVILVATRFLEISPPLREFLRTMGPVIACILTAAAVSVWGRIRRGRRPSREAEATSEFLGRVMDVDAHWSHPLAIGAEMLAVYQRSFAATVAARNSVIDDLSSDESALVVVSERIVEMSLRTADSLLSLLRAGHPDTAMGVARTLFELSVNLQIVILDRTGNRATRFRDFQEGEFLENMHRAPGGLSNQNYRDRLLELREKYGHSRFPSGSNEWIIKEDGSSTRAGMNAKLEYLHEEIWHSGKALQSELMRTWVWLNQWAHGTQISAYRRIAGRNEVGYLVWKREDGLNAPMVIAFITLRDIMTTYIQLAENLTGASLREELGKLEELIVELEEAIASIDPGLLNHEIQIISESELVSSDQS